MSDGRDDHNGAGPLTGDAIEDTTAEGGDDPAAFRRLLRSGAMDGRRARRAASWAVSQVWSHFHKDGSCWQDAVDLLCEIAAHEDPSVADAGHEALFSSLVEPLGDSFRADYGRLYDMLFVRVIDRCRRLRASAELDQELERFGLHTAHDLLERKRLLDERARHPAADIGTLKKVILLSRVTLGAEVAVTSVLIARLLNAHPQARCVVLGAPVLRGLFAGDDRISIHEIEYRNSEGLLARLQRWRDGVRARDEEIRGLQRREFLVIDPDSRLTQLGLLPVVEDEERYLFFPSRTYGETGCQSIGQLTAHWAGRIVGGGEAVHPVLRLAEEDWGWARTLRGHLEETGAKHVVTMNFGVGGNPAKRLSEAFERDLIVGLLDSGSRVILAKGVTPEETARSERLLARIAARGRSCREIDSGREGNVPGPDELNADVLAWSGGVGRYCALIGSSDEYIGYDSSGQHIAAALGTPTIDIFAYSPFPLFMSRWRPFGPGRIHLVDATGTGEGRGSSGHRRILQEVLERHQANRGLRGGDRQPPAGSEPKGQEK